MRMTARAGRPGTLIRPTGQGQADQVAAAGPQPGQDQAQRAGRAGQRSSGSICSVQARSQRLTRGASKRSRKGPRMRAMRALLIKTADRDDGEGQEFEEFHPEADHQGAGPGAQDHGADKAGQVAPNSARGRSPQSL